MARIKKLYHYIISAFASFTFTPDKIEVDTTDTVEQAWKNVGGYLQKSMDHYKSEIK